MWEAISGLLAFAVLMLVMHYFLEPEELFKDIKKLRSSEPRLKALEDEVNELKKIVDEMQKSK